MDPISTTIITFAIVYLLCMYIKDYLDKQEQIKQRELEQQRYEAYKAKEASLPPMKPLVSADGDEFYIGSHFLREDVK